MMLVYYKFHSLLQDQYVFLHDAILEGITSGKTEMAVTSLARHLKELEMIDQDGESGFKKEFNVRSFITKHVCSCICVHNLYTLIYMYTIIR